MATLKYSRQREAIKSFLANNYEHPTAETVYLHVKSEFPNISLGTVYRNLNLLTDMGLALKITMPDGSDRFDGHVHPHNHFTCKCCGSVTDIEYNLPICDNELTETGFKGKIESASTMYFGQCQTCIAS